MHSFSGRAVGENLQGKRLFFWPCLRVVRERFSKQGSLGAFFWRGWRGDGRVLVLLER